MTEDEKQEFNAKLRQKLVEQAEKAEAKKIRLVEEAKEQLLARMREDIKTQKKTFIGLIKLC